MRHSIDYDQFAERRHAAVLRRAAGQGVSNPEITDFRHAKRHSSNGVQRKMNGHTTGRIDIVCIAIQFETFMMRLADTPLFLSASRFRGPAGHARMLLNALD